MKSFLGVICGTLAGALLSAAIGTGVYYRFPDELAAKSWGILLWGEHWFIRAVVSSLCAAWSGFIAGLISRKHGNIVGLVSVAPGWLIWAAMVYLSITGRLPFVELKAFDTYVSIGNKLSTGVILISLFPIAWHTGRFGELYSANLSKHFDSRPNTLLGIKWYHFFWIPIILQLISMQGAYVGLYLLIWLKALWKAGIGFNIFSYFIPAIFTLMLYGTLYLMGMGVINAYKILAGFEVVNSRGRAAILVLKYAIGYQVIAVIGQTIIETGHFYLAKWIG